MRRKFVFFFVVLILIGAVIGALVYVDHVVKMRTTRHVFELDNVPQFLSEEMAIAYARKSLVLEGFTEFAWEIREDGRTVDPNGRTDKYVVRNSINPNHVSMIFVNKNERKARCVDVELQDKQIVCSVTIPK